jgi:sensor domain CHASE-containing protein
MKIRSKIISLLALLFAVLLVLEIAIQKKVLLPSFAELEQDEARTAMTRIDNALDLTLANLQLEAQDWGNWADAYNFVRAPNDDFVTTNITPVALRQLQINVLMMVDSAGRVVLAKAVEMDSGAPLAVDFTAQAALPAEFPWRHRLAQGLPAKGLLKTDHGILLLAGAPIRDGTGTGPSVGMVLLGRFLTQSEIARIGAEAQVKVSMTPADGVAGRDQLIEADRVTLVSRTFDDIAGRPLMAMRVEIPRKVTERGREAVLYASGCLLLAGTAALALLVIVLNRMVLSPLARVTRHAVAVGENVELNAPLTLPGGDEMAVLARELDRMVGRLAESRRQLMDQSFQAGFAELSKGVLHNLGNTMTPLGVRVAKLGDRLRRAPSADIELAAAELALEQPGTQRYADLREFLRLASRELIGVLKEAEADVAVIEHQTSVVQTALAELMQSTHSEPILERVRLPELIAQTLEIVPDACRQRLTVVTDDSVQKVGIVLLARTVLRLVLQNFLINSADAVRDAGREKGVFRVAAEIESHCDGPQLHLSCEDDGVGIPQGDLKRVFERGFSTKSRDTNYGIGLHWCANAVTALGGQIWAASAGPGRGASMHVLLPLNA